MSSGGGLLLHSASIDSSAETPVAAKSNDTHLWLELLVKAADISNVVKPFPVARAWAIRITDEFFLQGDLERARGMEVTSTCNRETQSRVELQKGFIDFVCEPFFTELASVHPLCAPLLAQMHANREAWETYSDDRLLSERTADAFA